MGEYTSLKMKRKEIEDVYDDFSDFSLSSPALKIRRLDAELPPIIEEPEPSGPPQDVDLDLDTPLQEEDPSPSVPVNEERALVLYKPVNSSVSPNMCITVNPDLIPGYKNGVFWSGRHVLLNSAEDKSEFEDDKGGNNGCLAVVPWVSNPFDSASLSEPMEAEGGDAGAMEIEEDYSVPRTTYGPDGGVFPQWQQQHCMTPQVPPSTTTTPVMWSW